MTYEVIDFNARADLLVSLFYSIVLQKNGEDHLKITRIMDIDTCVEEIELREKNDNI